MNENTITMNDFVRLNFLQKMLLIEFQGTLIDTYTNDQQNIRIYSLHDFFLEIMVSAKSGYITDIIPYKRGFKVDQENQGLQINMNAETESLSLSA